MRLNVRRIVDYLCRLAPGRQASHVTADPRPAAVLLEAAVGVWAVGAFAVANHLPRAVTATFDLSPFRDERGRPAPVAPEVRPRRVDIAPAQRVVVRVVAAITDEMTAATSYSGFVSVPGITDQPIPIIVRRTA